MTIVNEHLVLALDVERRILQLDDELFLPVGVAAVIAEAIAEAEARGRKRGPMLCTSCGTVCSTDECDCTKMGMERLSERVPYIEHLKSEAERAWDHVDCLVAAIAHPLDVMPQKRFDTEDALSIARTIPADAVKKYHDDAARMMPGIFDRLRKEGVLPPKDDTT